MHIRPALLASSANILQVTLLEGAAFTAGAASYGENMNRNYPPGPSGFITLNATSVSGGTTIFQDVVGSTSNAGQGGSKGLVNERVLKPDTNYVVKFTNAGATTATVGYYTLFWYIGSRGK